MPLFPKYQSQILLFFLFLSSMSFAQTSSNSALHFDGTKDYINMDTIADTISQLDDFTIEFWMKADKDSQSMIRTTFFAANKTVGDNRFLIVFGAITDTSGRVIIYDENSGGSKFDILSNAIVGDNKCHHIAYSKKGTKGSLYIDGILDSSHIADYQLSKYDKYSIGQDWDYGGAVNSDFYRGNMSDFRLWNNARTKTEIKDNMNSELTGTESGLIVLYHMNEGLAGLNNTSITKVDDDASGFHGHLNGFTLTGLESNYVNYNCSDIASIAQIEPSSDFNIYPIPSNGELNIESTAALETITIYDMLGKMVFNETYNQIESSLVKLNVAHLNSGYYIARIIDQNGNMSQVKIVLE